MAELVDGQPLFPGESDIDQLYVIQRLVGQLTQEQQTLFLRNPRFAGLKFPDMSRPETLDRKYGASLPAAALDFLKLLLTIEPSRRPTCSQCLQHPYLSCLAGAADSSTAAEAPSRNASACIDGLGRRGSLGPGGGAGGEHAADNADAMSDVESTTSTALTGGVAEWRARKTRVAMGAGGVVSLRGSGRRDIKEMAAQAAAMGKEMAAATGGAQCATPERGGRRVSDNDGHSDAEGSCTPPVVFGRGPSTSGVSVTSGTGGGGVGTAARRAASNPKSGESPERFGNTSARRNGGGGGGGGIPLPLPSPRARSGAPPSLECATSHVCHPCHACYPAGSVAWYGCTKGALTYVLYLARRVYNAYSVCCWRR
uniref:Protein kinase domain-containing protein n=1 Tax=Chlamydomonas euryale TaxID=1486919 RepID=A0A6U2FBQ0_9CHLO